jgi:hypothetical protein|tara:strand:- start:345 stop:497 length:153 start_codon:yes stop_codon:yes gene_type:complete
MNKAKNNSWLGFLNNFTKHKKLATIITKKEYLLLIVLEIIMKLKLNLFKE